MCVGSRIDRSGNLRIFEEEMKSRGIRNRSEANWVLNDTNNRTQTEECECPHASDYIKAGVGGKDWEGLLRRLVLRRMRAGNGNEM